MLASFVLFFHHSTPVYIELSQSLILKSSLVLKSSFIFHEPLLKMLNMVLVSLLHVEPQLRDYKKIFFANQLEKKSLTTVTNLSCFYLSPSLL